MIDLKNLNIIVTGATGIIGNSILEKLILGGSNILATGTNEEKLEQIKNKYENQGDSKHVTRTNIKSSNITKTQSKIPFSAWVSGNSANHAC